MSQISKKTLSSDKETGDRGEPENQGAPYISSPSENAPEEVSLFPWFKAARERLRHLRGRKEFSLGCTPLSSLKVLIVSDAWLPQTNGVVRTLQILGEQLADLGNEVRYITPDQFRSVALPGYSEIQLAMLPGRRVRQIINEFQPDAIHIATEGPLGIAARQFCVHRDHPFTTSFHTRFPEYLNARTHFPVKWGYEIQKRFHKPASTMMVTTPALMEELYSKGFRNIRIWSRGVDLEKFRIYKQPYLEDLPRPIWVYVGRVSVEKNLESFLDLDLEGTKLIVGDGPQKAELERKYKDAVFVGSKYDEDLARHYSASDVFVFPSKTDTFGLVNVEALACGTPVAALPVVGPKDILAGSNVGAVDWDLATACRKALGIATPEECRKHALNFSWERGTKQFIENLALPGHDEAYWLESANFPD